MWSAPETLRSRMRKRLQDAGPTAIRTRQLADAYDAPGGPASFYEDWFRHSEKWHGRHFVIEDTDVIRVRPLTEWAITAQQNAGQSSQVVDAVLGK